MNLDFGRCQVYKLNISACLTERELDYYNLFCDGITRKELKKRLGVDYPTSEMLSEEFHISLEDAADLLKAQMNKKCFRKFLTDEIEKFSPNEVREIRKSAIYVADEEGNLTDRIKDNKKIVWFGNECVRRCNVDLKDIPLLDQFLLLKCGSKALTGVLNQIVERGVNLDGKHYLFYTSTTGQMKETEITLVEEEYWKENEYALMCGLTEERINSKGGINMGKYFAAKALNLSNSIKYDSGISIDEVIIVPDFKTFVSGMVNYLDVNTLDIQEKKMEIEIEHMDGAGIFIPGTFPCSCQIRGGWLKGAVFPFDFHKFIEKYRDKVSAANMIDAWGNPVTVEEFLNAKMILTDSQLKMRKYYDSMQEYRKCFKKAKLSITVNNCAHQAKSEVKVAYQPFQTIPRDNLTDETIKKLADKTVRYIEDAKKNPKAALQLMGIEIDSEDMEDKMKDVEMNVLHAAILKYPQLLNDIHVQKIMKSVLLSERRKAQGCKLVLDGFWSYICPDLYAFCQWLFLGQDVPEGLVPNGYIYNHYYNDKEIEETCCLRYPHLSDCEHGIRKVLQSKECEEWFNGKISGMSLEYFADLTGISSKTCNRYNIILEKNHLLFVYRSNDKMKNFDGTMRQINNCYSRYCDKELCIAYATDYENRYGYEHKIVQTRKNKEEADKNRRLAAIYNRICEGHEYPIEVVREVQKYIRNKNQYLQKLIDEKKAQSYMAFSEKEWVARLESQLRDESVFLQAKLESDCEFESNIWGEPNPLDIFIEEAV